MSEYFNRKNYLPLFFLLLCIFFNGQSHSLSQQNRVDSLLTLLPQTEDKKDKCSLFSELSHAYRVVDPEKGIYFGELGKRESIDLEWREGLGKAMFALGSNYQLTAEFPKSLENFFGALETAEEIEDSRLTANTLSEIATVYRKTKDYEKAILYSEKSLEVSLNEGFLMEKVQNFNEIAISNAEMGNNEEAIKYFRFALELCKAENEMKHAAILIGNIGIIQKDEKNWKEAIESQREAAVIHQELNFGMGVGLCNQNIGTTYLEFYNDSLSTRENSGLGITKEASLDTALVYLQKSIPYFEEFAAQKSISLSLKTISQVFAEKSDYESALTNFKAHQALEDSIDSNDDKVALAQLGEERAEFEKTQQMKITDQQIKLTKLVEEKRRNETIAFITGLAVLLLFTLFVFRERRKSERLLLNILPKSVASELKKKGVSDAQLFNDVTILFTDFVGFTKVSERLTPKELVDE